ncbi:MAG: hypothetical protein V3S64_10800 [bacterium]
MNPGTPVKLLTAFTLLVLLWGTGIGLGNGGEEEDEGHYDVPVRLTLGNAHTGSVGSFSESFYVFRAPGKTILIAVTGKPPVRWRLFSGANFKSGLLHWCKPEPVGKRFSTACQVKGLSAGASYYLNVYSFSPTHSGYVIDLSAP